MRYSLRSLFVLVTVCCLAAGYYATWNRAWEHSDYTTIKPIVFGAYEPTPTYSPSPETHLCVVRYFHHEEDQYFSHYCNWPRLSKWPRQSLSHGILYRAKGTGDAALAACQRFMQSAAYKQDAKWLSHQSTEKSAYELGIGAAD